MKNWGCIHWYSWKILCSQINSQTNNAHKVWTSTIKQVIFNCGLAAEKKDFHCMLRIHFQNLLAYTVFSKWLFFDNFLYSSWQWRKFGAWTMLLILQSKLLKCSCFSMDLSGWIHSMPQKLNVFPFIMSNNSLYIGSISTLWVWLKEKKVRKKKKKQNHSIS